MASGSGARPDGSGGMSPRSRRLAPPPRPPPRSDNGSGVTTASNLRVWVDYLATVAVRRDLEKRRRNAALTSKRAMECLHRVIQLAKEERDLSRKLAFYKALSKFKQAMEAEEELDENVDFGALDESCIDELQKLAAENAGSVHVHHVQHAEPENISSLIEELTAVVKLLEGSYGFQLAKLSMEAACLEVATLEKQSKISASLKNVQDAVLQLKCVELLQRKGYIPAEDAAAHPECSGISSGCSTLDTASGPG